MPTPLQQSRVTVEIVAVAGGLTFKKRVIVPLGQTLGWAANASGLYALHPQLKAAALGVWGKVMAPTVVVQESDRIEIYAPVQPAATQAHRARLRQKANTGKVRA